MVRSTVDPSVLYKLDSKSLAGLIILQVDDILGIGRSYFLDLGDKAAGAFRYDPRIMSATQISSLNGTSVL